MIRNVQPVSATRRAAKSRQQSWLGVVLLPVLCAGPLHADPAKAVNAAPDPALPVPMDPPAIPGPDFSGPVYQAYATYDAAHGRVGTTYLTFVFTHGRLTNIVPISSEASSQAPSRPPVDDVDGTAPR